MKTDKLLTLVSWGIAFLGWVACIGMLAFFHFFVDPYFGGFPLWGNILLAIYFTAGFVAMGWAKWGSTEELDGKGKSAQ